MARKAKKRKVKAAAHKGGSKVRGKGAEGLPKR
jgi:hypothetical protein